MKKVLFTATVDSHILHFHLPYLKMFKEKGYEVHVATNTDDTIPFCDVKHKVSFERSPFKINNLKAIKQMKKILLDNNFDIVHTHTPMGSVVTRLAYKKVSNKVNTRMVYTAHGFHFYKGAPLLNWLLFYPAEKYLSKYTDTLITINKEDYELAKKKFKKCRNVEYVPGVGVDEDKFNFTMTKSEKFELRKSLGLKENDFVLIYPARLDKNKNQGLLIESMAELIKKHKDIHLLLPGEDELNGYYQKMAKEKNVDKNVHFLGYRNDIPRLLKISNVAVSTSKREGLGLSMIEAFMSGLPILITHNRGHNEIISLGVEGRYIDFTIHDIVDKVEFYMNDYIRINQKISNVFSLKYVISKMEKIYTNINQNLLYVHCEEKIKIDTEGNFYTDGCYNQKIWDRYFKIFPSITCLFRIEKRVYSKEYAVENFQKIDKRIKLITIEDRKESFFSYFSIKKYLNNIEIIKQNVAASDCVIARAPGDESYLAIKYSKRFHKKVLMEVVGCPLNTLFNYGIKGKFFSFPAYLKLKKNVKKADSVLYVTKNFLQKRYPTSKPCIACSDADIIVDEKNLNNRLQKITKDFDKGKLTILTVGTLIKYKGQQDIIKAIKVLKSKGYNIEYRIVGTGKEDFLKKIAKKYDLENNIVFYGGINHKKVFELIDMRDIYIQPSYTEGLSRALLEAISRACPSIATNVGGNGELVSNEYLYSKGDIGQLILLIEKMMNKAEMFKEANNNFNRAKLYDCNILDKKRELFYLESLVRNDDYD